MKSKTSRVPALCSTLSVTHSVAWLRQVAAVALWRPSLFAAVLLLLPISGAAQTGAAPAPEWSADLLSQILKADQRPANAVENASGGEMALHSYQLAHLRVGEAGRSQNVITILKKLLPPGSSMNPDVAANTLHVLTTETAHKAIWEYLSAVDLPESAPVAPSVPEEVKQALTHLAASSEHSAKLAGAIDALKSEMSRELAAVEAQQRKQGLRLGYAAIAAVALLAVVGWLALRSRPTKPAQDAAAPVLAPDQVASALVPVHDKMRTDMLGLLNEVAIKLQAQHQEQQKLVREQQQRIEDARVALADERRQFISEAGTMVVQAVERVDATTAKLARQQDKVAELVQELQHTVRELDETKDSLRDREVELEQERAKIAALSLLLEEGSPLPSHGNNGKAHRICAAQPNGTAFPKPLEACTTSSTTNRPTPHGTEATAPIQPRFTFLPPDHPEN